MQKTYPVCAVVRADAVGGGPGRFGADPCCGPGAGVSRQAGALVIAFSPGGPSDILSRLVGGKLSESMGQPFVMDNRPGAGGQYRGRNRGQERSDGYTLMIANNSILAANATLYKKMEFNPEKDLVRWCG